MEYKLAVFIGRFQPIHSSHLEVIRQGLSIAEKVLIVIGSAYAAPNIKNPFSADERREMISACLNEDELERVSFEFVRDYFYNENIWISDVQQSTRRHYVEGDSVALLGSYKDSSSYYLKLFPQFDFVAAKNTRSLNATDIRNQLFDLNSFDVYTGWTDTGVPEMKFKQHLDGLPLAVVNWMERKFIASPRHHSLIKEQQFIKDYKAKWATAPFTPTFVTVDAVVVQAGHVLLVRRKFEPGKGLLALPGGFIKSGETLEQSAIRELKEETGIRVHAPVLKSKIKDHRTFDHPERSLRGRTITHAYYIKLDGDELPEVKGNDDAEGAMWVPLMDLGRLESSFYEDHFHIVNLFINKGI